MIANHIHSALAQVREVQRRVVESQRFRGYSGRARAMGGGVALLGAWVMALHAFPETMNAHLIGWGAVLVISLAFNYFALLIWFLSEPKEKRDVRQLLPAVDPLFPMFVAGVLTWILIRSDLCHYLFGIWMCMYGLVNLASRWVLTRAVVALGSCYILAGTVCLLVVDISFLNPWPMGLVFFAGELLGGFILFSIRKPDGSIRAFFGF
jgi:hypothetical protein